MTVSENNSGIKLKRVLSLSDLIIYGIIIIQPIAALPLFGHANEISKGHAVTSILVAMLAMVFTAVSYGRMANLYPVAGSAFTYVGKSIHPYLGFVSGWSMFMDYMFMPILCIIFTSITSNHLLPFIPYPVWILFFSVAFTALNLNGIKMASRTNWVLMIVMSIVVFYFMIAAIRYVILKNGLTGLFSLRPVYNPETFSISAIGSATSLAALTYVGFDGITTLSEEVENPKRNVLLAAVITCLITGIWSGSQIYLAQLSWPDWTSFTQGLQNSEAKNSALDTAILSVAHRIGGSLLDGSLSVILLIGSFGSGVTGQLGASRLLYGMGRDKMIPKRIFGHLDKKHSNPSYNVIIVGVLAFTGACLLNYQESAHLINFGAFFAFMGVNIACMLEYYFKSTRKNVNSFLINFMVPAIGFTFSFIIWVDLPVKTFLIGGSWMLAGIIYLAIRSKGFREEITITGFSET